MVVQLTHCKNYVITFSFSSQIPLQHTMLIIFYISIFSITYTLNSHLLHIVQLFNYLLNLSISINEFDNNVINRVYSKQYKYNTVISFSKVLGGTIAFKVETPIINNTQCSISSILLSKQQRIYYFLNVILLWETAVQLLFIYMHGNNRIVFTYFIELRN